MKILPALYLKEGKAVLLKNGNLDDFEVISEDPLELARDFSEQGASTIHLVDLDGAQQGGPRNQCEVQQILSKTDLAVQVGGGIRDIVVARNYLHAGAEAVVVSTAAVTNPYFVEELLSTFGQEAVIVSLDVRDDKIVISGWEEESGLGVHSTLAKFIDKGATRFVYTDVGGDNLIEGLEARNLKAFTRQNIEVTISGRISSKEEIAEFAKKGVDRIILDYSLYNNEIKLEKVLQ